MFLNYCAVCVWTFTLYYYYFNWYIYIYIFAHLLIKNNLFLGSGIWSTWGRGQFGVDSTGSCRCRSDCEYIYFIFILSLFPIFLQGTYVTNSSSTFITTLTLYLQWVLFRMKGWCELQTICGVLSHDFELHVTIVFIWLQCFFCFWLL